MAKRELSNGIKLPGRPFWRGIARLFDFSGELDRELIAQIRANSRNRTQPTSAEESLRKTWRSVGDSMRWAIGEYETERGLAGNNGERLSEAESVRRARQEDLMILLGLVDADEKRVSAIWRSVDERWQRALDSNHNATNGNDSV